MRSQCQDESKSDAFQSTLSYKRTRYVSIILLSDFVSEYRLYVISDRLAEQNTLSVVDE